MKRTSLWVPGWSMDASHWGTFPDRWGHVHRHVDFASCTQKDDFSQRIVDRLLGVDVVVAWSFGAVVALDVLADHSVPLVVVGGALQFVQACNEVVWARTVIGMREAPVQTLERFTSSIFGAPRPTTWTLSALHEGLDVLAHSDVRAAWARRKDRTLWIHGTHDRICPVRAAPPEAVRISGAGHAPFVDQADAVQEVIDRWCIR
ncbi:MAG: alpha/beta fold hydrolase [Paenibacillaceae bacterium]|nr:alpha/beta fold hydrolase [Paenibacillaceae bacterium]